MCFLCRQTPPDNGSIWIDANVDLHRILGRQAHQYNLDNCYTFAVKLANTKLYKLYYARSLWSARRIERRASILGAHNVSGCASAFDCPRHAATTTPQCIVCTNSHTPNKSVHTIGVVVLRFARSRIFVLTFWQFELVLPALTLSSSSSSSLSVDLCLKMQPA